MTVALDLVDLHASPQRTASKLHAHEQRVLALAASGWGTAAVAADLELSPEAVDRLLRSIIAKVGARSKVEAVLIAIRDGLIDLPNGPDEGDGHTGVYRASAVRPVARLLRWMEEDRRNSREPVHIRDVHCREDRGHRDQVTVVGGAAT